MLALPDDLAEMLPPTEDDAAKPKFPANDELAETAAVMTALLASSKPLSLTEVARHFKGGKQNERRVRLVRDCLARLAHVSSSDGGASFALRRGAQTRWFIPWAQMWWRMSGIVPAERLSPGRAETRGFRPAGLGRAANLASAIERGPRPFGEGPPQGCAYIPH